VNKETIHDILEAIHSYATGTDRRLEKIEGRLDTMDGRLMRVESQMVTNRISQRTYRLYAVCE